MERVFNNTEFAHSISDDLPLRRVVKYIYDNLEKEITHDELAKVSGYNKHYFNRYFKSKMSLSPMKWTWHLRLTMAFSNIRSDPSVSIESIAISYGFSSVQNFSNSFKRAFGLRPTQARLMADVDMVSPLS